MNNFYENHHREYFNNTFKIDPEIFLSPLIGLLNPGDSILDIGCGSGRDLLWCSQRGFQAVGFEQSPSLAMAGESLSLPYKLQSWLNGLGFEQSRLIPAALFFGGKIGHAIKHK